MAESGYRDATGAQAREDGGAVFRCASCGHAQSLPEELLGRQARCPKCSTLGRVRRPWEEAREPDERDVRLDDLIEACPAPGAPGAQSSPARGPLDALALDKAPTPVTVKEHLRNFFSGSLPVNVLAGIVAGVRLCLVCLALSLLVLLVDGAQGLSCHALALTLLPAVLGSALFALQGRLPVALGGPDPSASVSVFLLLAALSADMAGRASVAEVTATLLAALALSALVSGLLGIILSRVEFARRVRYLPDEVLGGIFAGFGLLLVKAWAQVMLTSYPELTVLADAPLAELPQVLASTAWVWGPAVGFAALTFAIHLGLRGIIWPMLLIALVVGGWNVLPQAAPGLFAQLSAAQGPLPELLRFRCSLALFDPQNLDLVNWAALFSRLEFFLAAAAMAILPSIVRVNILESILHREADGEEQMRMVGAASLLSGAFGALPSSLTLSGSLGMRALGATGPVAGFLAGMVCLGFLLGGVEVLPYIPKFLPLGILLAIGLIMPVSWMLRDGRNPFSRRDDLRAAWAACLLVALLGPVVGVFLSLGLGLFMALSRAVAGEGVRLVQTGEHLHSNVERSPAESRVLREHGGGIVVLRLHGYLFLGTLYGVLRLLRTRCAGASSGLKFVLLDLAGVNGLGAGAVIGFRRLENFARQAGLELLFTGVPLEVGQKLELIGYRMDDAKAPARIFVNLDYALEWCEEHLLAQTGTASEQRDSLEELLAASFPEPSLVPALMRCLVRVELPNAAVVLRQGDASDCMYFLQSGRVRVELALPGGKILRLKKLGPGTVFGEMGLYTSAPRSASVIASGPCVLYRLSARRFNLIQAKAPQLAAAVNRFVVGLLAERVAEANAKAHLTQA